MSEVTNGRVVFKSIPEAYPIPGENIVYDTSEKIDLDNVPLNGGILLKTLEVSVDPYMRGRMRDASIESYAPAFHLNESIDGFGVAVVVRSESSEAKKGDYVYGMIQYQNYNIVKDLKSTNLSKFVNSENLPLSTYVGVLGMPGKTAFMAWREYSKAKKGETAFVSTGAGPVGSLVIQLAKMDGLKVIGSAGSADKVQFMKECGADVAFNYKKENVADVLKREGPIDMRALPFNYSGVPRQLTMLKVTGTTSAGRPSMPRLRLPGLMDDLSNANLFQVVSKSLSIHGFITGRLEAKHNEDFYKTIPPLVANGTIKHQEQVFHGLEKVGDVILAVQKGENTAKAVVHVADA
ncbi:hypothetical protein D9613_011267 [Agrocybe pediades]|uniref:Enoyl reductase (ER) domain-containing protein n=1 Tax=Agrocybe pediades TaxID=84607 RepID=A0A8H4QSN1_9AGAR|nr:hypothetical protein D9613_011267 [Agrocybe pediades]